MKTKAKKMIGVMLTIFMLVLSSMEVCAAEMIPATEAGVEQLEMISLTNKLESNPSGINPKSILYNCLICVNSSSSGMRVTFSTDCSQVAATIGVKNIVIKQKVWYGWKKVATSTGGYYTNASMYLGEILFTNAIKDETYRITCTHYADADEYTEVDGELEFIFTY